MDEVSRETVFDALRYFCGVLSPAQVETVERHLVAGSLSGIGRALGRMAFFPLVCDAYGSLKVVDEEGNLALPADRGQRSMADIVAVYQWEARGIFVRQAQAP